jgi:hypothetical protein
MLVLLSLLGAEERPFTTPRRAIPCEGGAKRKSRKKQPDKLHHVTLEHLLEHLVDDLRGRHFPIRTPPTAQSLCSPHNYGALNEQAIEVLQIDSVARMTFDGRNL